MHRRPMESEVLREGPNNVLASPPVILRFAKVQEQLKNPFLQCLLLLRIYWCTFLTSFSGN